MNTARPGQYEYQVEAELSHEFIRHGARTPAYNHIVASGPNACVLRGWVITPQARRSDTSRTSSRCVTASRLRAGPTTFPPQAP